ncbi:Fanconi anemia core complex-associated protein 100 [Lemmus lemmus]
MAVANAGQKIKELLLDIGDVSERVSFLKKAVDQRNKAITSLNEAMNVSCALLSSQEGARPISCAITTSWSRLELRDMLVATCTLENSSSFSLDQGWTLCIQAPCMPGSACERVETFLKACQAPGSEPTGAASLRAKYLPPSIASIRVSAVLLRTALEDGHSGFHLCSATLQWLLAENAAATVVRAQTLSSIQGIAPDGTDVNLIVREVAVTDLSPAGPIQAVEIQVESSSLANMCRAHHAIIRRMQALVTEQAAQGSSPPDLRMQYLHQIHANHQELLREVQTLRDQLCTEDEVSSYNAAQKLLHVYKQLRNPSLVLL